MKSLIGRVFYCEFKWKLRRHSAASSPVLTVWLGQERRNSFIGLWLLGKGLLSLTWVRAYIKGAGRFERKYRNFRLGVVQKWHQREGFSLHE
ncbi:hypothetical protein TNCV_1005501 [Trichonephila clavipes]|nr:hypothetical protein TNCV_1005501 [Trichonephila clavipes]